MDRSGPGPQKPDGFRPGNAGVSPAPGAERRSGGRYVGKRVAGVPGGCVLALLATLLPAPLTAQDQEDGGLRARYEAENHQIRGDKFDVASLRS